MKKSLFILAILVATLYSKWLNIDKPHSNVGFISKHLGISNVNGNFNSYEAKVNFDEKNKIPRLIEANIKTASIFTKNQRRDANLTSPLFFDVKNYPEITFNMKDFKNDKIFGVIEIKNIKKNVVFDYKFNGEAPDKNGSIKNSFTISGIIKRKDFNIGKEYPETLVNNDIKIIVDIEAEY